MKLNECGMDGCVCVCVELGVVVPKSNNVPLSDAVATQGKTFRVRRNPGVLPSESATCVQLHKYWHLKPPCLQGEGRKRVIPKQQNARLICHTFFRKRETFGDDIKCQNEVFSRVC